MTLPPLQVVRVAQVAAHADTLALLNQPVPHPPAPVVVGGRPTLVLDAATDEPVLLVDRFPGDLATYRRAVLAYPLNFTIRSGGIANHSRTFGYLGRQYLLRRAYCGACDGASLAPQAHATICDAAAALHRLQAARLPDQAAADMEAAQVVLPDWRLTDSPFTSGVVNRNSPLPYHVDGNNLQAWSAMVSLRRGTRQGWLHLPQYGLHVATRDGDVTMFPGWRLVHGVTPIQRHGDGYRFTVVYYPVKGLRQCLPADQEVQHAQQTRTALQDGLVERHRANYGQPE